MTVSQALDFLYEWNKVLGFQTPKHHEQIMRFLIDVFNNEPHRGLLNAFRHSGKSTVVGVFAACVLYHKPQTRILILSAETGLASRMVSHIKNILENHPWCEDILPDVKKEWGTHKITIKRVRAATAGRPYIKTAIRPFGYCHPLPLGRVREGL